MRSTRTRKLVTLAVLCALAYAIMVVGRVPVLTVPPFLKYDPKDVIFAISGFLHVSSGGNITDIIVTTLKRLMQSRIYERRQLCQ